MKTWLYDIACHVSLFVFPTSPYLFINACISSSFDSGSVKLTSDYTWYLPGDAHVEVTNNMSRLVRLCKIFLHICRISCPQASRCIYVLFVALVLHFCAWDWSWHRDSPALLYLVTLWDRAIRLEFCVWCREVTARITWKLSEKPQQFEQLSEGIEQLIEQLEQLLKQTEQLPGSF